jgi:hypothetical protein
MDMVLSSAHLKMGQQLGTPSALRLIVVLNAIALGLYRGN